MDKTLNLNMAARLLEIVGPAIVRGEYFERSFPNEADAAEAFGVSRTVIREAVKSLTAKGMVETRPRIGARVLPKASWNLLDADVLRWIVTSPDAAPFLSEFEQLRKAIEPMAAGLAAQSGAIEALAGIEEAYIALKHADPMATSSALYGFHTAVVDGAGNALLSGLQATMALPLKLLAEQVAASGRVNIDQYAAIVNAIRARDVVRAETATRWLLNDEGESAMAMAEAEGVKARASAAVQG